MKYSIGLRRLAEVGENGGAAKRVLYIGVVGTRRELAAWVGGNGPMPEATVAIFLSGAIRRGFNVG
jgi:hypothetical protein